MAKKRKAAKRKAVKKPVAKPAPSPIAVGDSLAAFRDVRKTDLERLAGMHRAELHKFAKRTGAPCGPGPCDLTVLMPWLMRRIAEGAPAKIDDDPLLAGSADSPALERYRHEKALLAKLDRLEREGDLLPRELVADGLAQISRVLRETGDALLRQFGTDAHELLDDALVDLKRIISQSFADASEAAAGDD